MKRIIPFLIFLIVISVVMVLYYSKQNPPVASEPLPFVPAVHKAPSVVPSSCTTSDCDKGA